MCRSGLCEVVLRGLLNWGPGILADPPTHPPTHPHQTTVPQENNEMYQRGPVDLRYRNLFLASDPPPPPAPGIVSTSHEAKATRMGCRGR